MPFRTEHAARQVDPKGFERFRRTHPDGWPAGLEAIWGIRADGSTAIQSVRADADRWTPAKFREWLAGADMKASIEEASGTTGEKLAGRIYTVAQLRDLADQLDGIGSTREKADPDTPADPDERRRGSDRNPPGSASDAGGIEFSEQTEESVRSMVADFNEGREAGRRISTATARAVVRRGFGAFSTSHRPGMNRVQWGLARLRAFLHLVRTGSPENPNYSQDNDLLPDWHRRSTKKAEHGDVDLTLPEYMRAALRRGLRAHEAGRTGDGIRPATIRMARQGAETGRWPAEKWVQARAWFRRHRSDWTRGTDTKPGDESPGFAAWLLWADGGDGRGRARVERIAEQIAGPIEKAASPVLRPPSETGAPDRPYVAEIDRDHAPNLMIEIPAGHVRSGVDDSGERWSVIMPAHYGDIRGTRGADGDPIDVFVGPDLDAEMVFVVAIANPDGTYDEDKVLLGFPSYVEAMAAFDAAYDRDDMILEVRAVDRWEFAWWLAEHGHMGHAFREPIAPGGGRSPGIVIKARHTVPLAHDPAHALIKFLTQIAQGVEMATGNRLTDINVEEVSPVDRAANGRTFAVVKSADGAPAADADVEKADSVDAPAGAAEATKAEGAEAQAAAEAPAADAAAADVSKADDAPTEIEAAKAEGPTTPPTIPVEPEPKTKAGPVDAMAEEALRAERDVESMMLKAAAGLLHASGGDMRKAVGALAGVDDQMLKAAADAMKAEHEDPMRGMVRKMGELIEVMRGYRIDKAEAPVSKAAALEPVDVAAAVEKAVGERLDALAGRVSAIEGQTGRPNGATGGESVKKSDKPGGWPSRLA